MVARRGIGYWPMNDGLDHDLLFARAIQGSDMAYIHTPLFSAPPSLEPLWDHWTARFRARGLPVFVALEPFTSGGAALNVPAGWTDPPPTCAHPDWREAYALEVVRMAARQGATYVCAAVEANAYFVTHPEDWPNFLSAFAHARARVRADVGEHVKVFASLQYEVATGVYGATPHVQQMLVGSQAPEQDLVGVSTYPGQSLAAMVADDLPADYYDDLAAAAQLAGKPVFFAEIGWHALAGGTPPGGNVTEQARFVSRLPTLCGSMTVEALNWILLRDPTEDAGTAGVFASTPEFTTLGLLDASDVRKPAYLEWLALRGAI